MITVLEVIEKTSGFLAEKGVPEPRLDAEHLIADALSLKRLDLYLQFNRPLPEEELEAIRARVRRRARREPLQHILGTADFFGLRLACDGRALIPRPETEELVSRVVERAALPPGRILDLGTGGGAIAIALAKAFPEAEAVATDFSERALDLARENARVQEVDMRIRFINTCWFDGVEGRFELVVSNPPYLDAGETSAAEPEVRDFEPPGSLTAEGAGVSALEHILRTAPGYLNPGGGLALETGTGHHARLSAVAEESGYAEWRGETDHAGLDRYFFARVPPA